MDHTTPGPLKPRLLALVAQGQAEQEAFIAQLSATERAAHGTPDAWTARDHIAHNAAWIADAARMISAAAHGETPAPSPEDTEYNPQIFAASQHQSWDAVLAGATAANAALRDALEACSEVDLTDPVRFSWREGRPLWTEAYVSGYEHPVEHYGQFYLESGDSTRATTVRQAAVETARQFIGDTPAYGFMLYNLGCFYAKTGRRDQAVATLREALARVPRLRAWSQEDPELDAVRDDPAFRALILNAAEAGTANSADNRAE